MSNSALEGEGISRTNSWTVDPDLLVLIGHDTKDGPEHPLFDPRVKEDPSEAFVLDVKERGVLEPVLVRKAEVDGKTRIEVVAGRKRTKAQRIANKMLKKAVEEVRGIQVTLRKGEDGDLFGDLIAENEHRAGDNMISKAEKLERFLALGKTEEDAAVAFGVSKVAIKNWLGVTKLSEKIKKMIRSGKISASAAGRLAGMPADEQVAEAERMVSQGEATTAEATRAARKKKGKKSKRDNDGVKPPGRVMIRKLVSAAEDKKIKRHPEFVLALRWAAGEIATARIGGLMDDLREAGVQV